MRQSALVRQIRALRKWIRMEISQCRAKRESVRFVPERITEISHGFEFTQQTLRPM